ERYGVTLTEERQAEVQLRSAAAMLRAIHAVDAAPLTTPRSNEVKLVGNCRDFSVLTVALLRYAGIPARARCGFGAYFRDDTMKYIDHWVLEYWSAEAARWVLVDAQLDGLQQEALRLDFDPLDVPHDRFITGGAAWQMARSGEEDPDQFGIFDMSGLWFIRGDMVRDLAALNNLPLLPWDGWGIMLKHEQDYTAADWALLDRVAELTGPDTRTFDAYRALYANDERLRVPPTITSWVGAEAQQITLADVTEPLPPARTMMG
ncbi:MAG: transglutaminase domain-containing protein, partial [Anaerolineae bacterium]|nr:transglutaminase domain-containing protein [Anaerolineae bacterium]